jgi:aryl-alcohol dehydrogenase
MEITAAVARAPKNQLTIEKLELDPPRSNEILVRLTAVGICHTDIAMRDQAFPVPQPIVLGHEGSGVVAAVGAGGSKVKHGDHVVMSFNGSVATLQLRRDRLAGCFSWPLQFAVFSSGGNSNRR